MADPLIFSALPLPDWLQGLPARLPAALASTPTPGRLRLNYRTMADVSGTVLNNNRVMLKRVAALTKKPNLRIWADMGGAEGPEGLADARALRDALLAKGWRLNRDLIHYEEPRAEHNEAAWARRLGERVSAGSGTDLWHLLATR